MESLEAAEPSLYIAVLLFAATSEAPNYSPLYEESFVLIKAELPETAYQKALSFGRQQQTTYQNQSGQTIVWSFQQVVDVSPALSDSLEEVTELYARHFRNYEAYCKFEPLLGDPEAQL